MESSLDLPVWSLCRAIFPLMFQNKSPLGSVLDQSIKSGSHRMLFRKIFIKSVIMYCKSWMTGILSFSIFLTSFGLLDTRCIFEPCLVKLQWSIYTPHGASDNLTFGWHLQSVQISPFHRSAPTHKRPLPCLPADLTHPHISNYWVTSTKKDVFIMLIC